MPSLQTLSVLEHGVVRGTPDATIHVLDCIRRHFSKFLRHITYRATSRFLPENDSVEPISRLASPLMTIRNLETVDITMLTENEVSSDALEAMAKAWPLLVTFKLNVYFIVAGPVADDLRFRDELDYLADVPTQHLLHFARHCPRLETLYLPIYKERENLLMVDEVDTDFPARDTLRVLVIGQFIPGFHIAPVLLRLFPKLDVPLTLQKNEEFPRDRIWGEVEDMFYEVWRLQRQKEKRAKQSEKDAAPTADYCTSIVSLQGNHDNY